MQSSATLLATLLSVWFVLWPQSRTHSVRATKRFALVTSIFNSPLPTGPWVGSNSISTFNVAQHAFPLQFAANHSSFQGLALPFFWINCSHQKRYWQLCSPLLCTADTAARFGQNLKIEKSRNPVDCLIKNHHTFLDAIPVLPLSVSADGSFRQRRARDGPPPFPGKVSVNV